jgi:diacylglycerol kinase family enzyme
MTIVLVYNPHSGSALPLSELRKMCAAHGIEVKEFIAINHGFEKRLQKYIRKDQIIAVVGGDGTVGSVAAHLVNTSAILAPLPGGTLNHFTKDLGVPQDLDEAFKGLKRGKVTPIDTSTINGVIFLNNSSIGIYPSSLKVRDQLEKGRSNKYVSMIIGSIYAFTHYKTFRVTIEGKKYKTPFIFVGNNDYHLRNPSGPGRKKLDEGMLSAYMLLARSRMAMFAVLGNALIGKLRQDKKVKTWKTTELHIETRHKTVDVSHDGELTTLKSPLEYKLLPKSLRIIGSS